MFESALMCVVAVVLFMPEVDKAKMGGTMRLGRRRTILSPECLSAQLYGRRKRSTLLPEIRELMYDRGGI